MYKYSIADGFIETNADYARGNRERYVSDGMKINRYQFYTATSFFGVEQRSLCQLFLRDSVTITNTFAGCKGRFVDNFFTVCKSQLSCLDYAQNFRITVMTSLVPKFRCNPSSRSGDYVYANSAMQRLTIDANSEMTLGDSECRIRFGSLCKHRNP